MSDVTYLVSDLRLYLYDLVEPYTYTDDLLDSYLQQAIKMLGSRWNYRYMVDSEGTVTRSSTVSFTATSPPVIEFADEAKIILQASIIIKAGTSFNSSWDVASWKDDEISYSNIQGARSRDTSIARDDELLELLLKGRLFAGKVYELPGFHLPLNTDEGTM